MHRLLLLFVDGIGLATATASNPLACVPMPHLARLVGGPLTIEQVGRGSDTVLAAVDACLGVDGLPQSATGQTALFTGKNAAALLGRHVSAFPGPRLQAILGEHSLFVGARRGGHAAAFANAFSARYFELVAARRLRFSASVWAARAASVPLRGEEALDRGEAVSWDIVCDRFVTASETKRATIPAPAAGTQLAAVANAHQITLYETFLTDLAGHRRFGLEAAEVLGRLDGLLGGVLAARAPELTIVLVSDHGNLEEAGHKSHTRNPVPLLAHGPLAGLFGECASILDVTPVLLAGLADPTGEAASQ